MQKLLPGNRARLALREGAYFAGNVPTHVRTLHRGSDIFMIAKALELAEK
jgi:hypothetical protein